jgi:peptide/nickel transport system ATP-binding protein
MSNQPASAVSAEGLTVRIRDGGTDIVQDIKIEIARGEILGLVGESGSGKSTLGLGLLWHANRGLMLSQGEVILGGVHLSGMDPKELRQLRGRRMSYVPQDPGRALNPAIRVGEQLREILALSGQFRTETATHARLVELMNDVGLPSAKEFLHRYPHQLSGGQQQRITIALAFACRPTLVVLDEPTTGLDVMVQKRVLATIRDLCTRYGVAALYVSHDLAVVANLSDRTAVIYAGRIVELGPTRTVLMRPAHPYTRRLLAAVPEAQRRHALVGIPGRAPLPGQIARGCRYHPRCDFAQAPCADQEPELAAINPDQSARCWFSQQVQSAPAIDLPLTVKRSAASERTKSLVIDRLTARYNGVPVVHDVSLAVAPGECLALVGQSGSGKTTVSRCVAGMHEDYAGRISFGDVDLAHRARSRTQTERRALQYIFQNPYSALNPRRTIEEILVQWAQVLIGGSPAEQRKTAARALDLVELGAEILGRYSDELSGGQQQRVAIARALVPNPAFLICDEVTSALDVSVQASVVTLLGQLARDQGLGMLFITHNLPLVSAIADRVAVMQAGRIVEIDSAETIFASPRDAYTRDLLASTPSLTGALTPATATA